MKQISYSNKYMPIFPKATGHPTIYIEGYPSEDDEPMAANFYHAEQISTFHEQLKRYYWTEPDILIGLDSFIYYSEGDMKKCVTPDIFVVYRCKKISTQTQLLYVGRRYCSRYCI